MRTLLAAVVALSALAGAAGAAFAVDKDTFPHDFWKQQERNLP